MNKFNDLKLHTDNFWFIISTSSLNIATHETKNYSPTLMIPHYYEVMFKTILKLNSIFCTPTPYRLPPPPHTHTNNRLNLVSDTSLWVGSFC